MPKPKRYELSLDQWAKIAGLLPGKAGDPGCSATIKMRLARQSG